MIHQNKFEKNIRNRYVQHTLFWAVSFYVLYRLFAYSEEVEWVDIIYTFLFHLSIVFVVYFNLRLLIPKYLEPRKYLHYIFGLSVLILVGIFLNMATFNWMADFIFPNFYFIDYYKFTDILEFIFAFVFLTSLLKFSKSWFRHLETNQLISLLEKEKLDAEINALKGQINPHFLFNSLNNLYSLSLDEDKRVPGIILRISGMMRYLLYDTNVEMVSLGKELDHLKNYIEMQTLRIGDKNKIKFVVNGDANGIKIAPLLFLPLVENAFKHGGEDKSGNFMVNILMNFDEKEIMFSVENSKGEISNELEKNEGGVGLENLRRRLQLIYPGKHDLSIVDDIESYSNVLKISLL